MGILHSEGASQDNEHSNEGHMPQALPNQNQMQSLTSAWCAAKPRRCTTRFTLGKPLSLPFMLPTFRPYCKRTASHSGFGMQLRPRGLWLISG